MIKYWKVSMSKGLHSDLRKTVEELKKPSGLIKGKNWLRHAGQAQRIDEMLLIGATKYDIAQDLIKKGIFKKDINIAIQRVQRHIDHIRKEEHKIPLAMDSYGVWQFNIKAADGDIGKISSQDNHDQPQFFYDPLKRTVKMLGNMEHIYDYYEEKGYFFPKEIITRYFLSLKTKPFVILTGISGTGKTKIAQIFAEYMCQNDTPGEDDTPKKQEAKRKENRIAFVPVRPDWMDNKGPLGYYNLLDQKYHATPVLRLLLEAEGNPEKPYFVILDEMNLAKVEQYFSDFLSIMESRTNGNPQGELLYLHSVDKAETPDGFPIPQKLHIPPNVYFTGTVNVDESTYLFSPKVLDRANVIEFNNVDLKSYENGAASLEGFVLEEQDIRKKLLPVSGEAVFCSKTDYTKILGTAHEVRDYLSKILDILHPYNLHFGYRVVNEIARFIGYANAMVENSNLEETLDIQILQKILPKFHGTQAKLEEPLGKLLAFCYGDDAADESYLEKAIDYDESARFPRSAQKLARMIGNLKLQGYTSFIE